MTSYKTYTGANPPLGPEEFRRCLADTGLSIDGLARRLGLAARLVRHWYDGTTKPSAAARFLVRYLAARARGEPDPLDLERAHKKGGPG